MIYAAVKSLLLFAKLLPINQSNYINHIRQRFGPLTAKHTFMYVKLLIKQAKLKKDLEFLRTCKHEQLAPTFVRVKIPNTHQHYKRAIHSFRMQLLNDEIKIKKRKLTKNYKLSNNMLALLKDSITGLTLIKLKSIFQQMIKQRVDTWVKTHAGKLQSLRGEKEKDLPKNNHKNNNNNTILPDTPPIITNLSTRQLTEEETSVLQQGLDFVFPPTRFDDRTFIANMETYFVNLLGHATDKRDYETKEEEEQTIYHLTPTQLQCANKLRSSCNSFRYGAMREINTHKQATTRAQMTINRLSKDTSIIITRPDKGRGVVILNKNDYIKKMGELLADSSTFQRIEQDQTIKQENRLNRKLAELKNNGFLTEQDYQYARSRGSQPARIYGLPKTHKVRDTEGIPPLRPIVSSSNTFNYRLAKLLAMKINHIRQNPNIIKDTFSFVDWLHKLKLNPKDYKMLSFDITSLFTKVPLDQTIKIILDKMYGKEHTCLYSKNPKSAWCQTCKNRHEMKTLLEMATKETHFTFNGEIFCQRNGIAMGSPLGPIFADVYVSYLEEKFMKRIQSVGVEHYKRFVDDTFTLVHKDINKNTILDILNSYDSEIQFTCEEEMEHRISFLDVSIERAPTDLQTPFLTRVYRKPTFTGLLLKWASHVPRTYKVSAISSMVYRAIRICSTYKSLTQEFDKIRALAWNNGYPANFTDAQIRNTLNRHYEHNSTSPIVSIQTQGKKKEQVFVDIPFFRKHTEKLGKKLINIAETVRPQLHVQPIPRPPSSIGMAFSSKDKIPLLLKSGIVYKVSCQDCPANYIGKTLRQLDRRLQEHGKPLGEQLLSPTSNPPEDVRRSNRQTKPMQRYGTQETPHTAQTTDDTTIPKNVQSALSKHSSELQHKIDWTNVQMLDKDRSPYRLLVRESLLIRQMEPVLNRTTNSIPLLVFPEGLVDPKPTVKMKNQHSDRPPHHHGEGTKR